jgi:hypothetical protein
MICPACRGRMRCPPCELCGGFGLIHCCEGERPAEQPGEIGPVDRDQQQQERRQQDDPADVAGVGPA